MFIKKIANALEGTRIYNPIKRIWNRFLSIIHFIELLYYNITHKDGIYHRISVNNNQIKDFHLILPKSRYSRRARMKGQWEPKVLDVLVRNVDSNSVFWEVGGGWGYFSNALAGIVKEVYTFEANAERALKIRLSAERNSYDNINLIDGMVGEDVDLSNIASPDVALVDIEGHEFELLNKNRWLLEQDIIFCIEIHPNEDGVDNKWNPNINPDGVKSLLKQNGYEIKRLDFDTPKHHILATPPN